MESELAAVLLVRVQVTEVADEEELDEAANELLYELDEIGEISVEFAPGERLPAGAMGASLAAGTLLLKILEAGGITGLLSILGSWLSRDERRNVTLQIGENRLEVTGVTAEKQAELINWFKLQTGLKLDA